jgi:N-acyl homoserine lactone hydrolase
MATVSTVLQGYSISTDQGIIGFCGVTLVQGSKRILVDTAHVGRRTLLLQKLKQMGLTPKDIDVVVLTHAHWDHSLNMDVFPEAEFVIHHTELEYAHNPHPDDWATPAYTGIALDQMKLRPCGDGEAIDEGVRILSTPGHSPGSITVLAETQDGVAGICGDALPNAAAAVTGTPYLIFWDEADAKESVTRILQSAELIYPGHDRPFRKTADGTRYLEGTSIRVLNLPALDPGEGQISAGVVIDPPRQTWALNQRRPGAVRQ